MNIIEPSVQLEAVTQLVENNNIQQGLNVEKVIEKAGRTCYKSEDKITEDSSSKFCEMIQTRNHVSVLEHCSATFRIICDRGCCYDDQTKVLTENGWKVFKDLNVNERVYTKDDEDNIVLTLPKRCIKKHYVGKLFNFSNTGIDLAVTPNHNMWVKDYNKRSSKTKVWKFIKAEEMSNSAYQFDSSGNWVGNKLDYIHIKGNDKSKYASRRSKNYEANSFLELLGLWVTDGSISPCVKNSGRRICITQIKKHVCNRIEQLCADLNIPFLKYRNDYRLNDVALWNFLKENFIKGDDYKKSYYVEVPQWLLNSSRENLDCFMRGVLLGDGYSDSERRLVYTSSEGFAENLVEIAMKRGFGASIRVARPKGTLRHFPNNSKVSICTTSYCVNIEKQRFSYLKKRSTASWRTFEYNGNVYCVELPKYHKLFVMRNGKACWCGNSHELVRHRIAAYSQESTRYVNYNKKGMGFITPAWASEKILKERQEDVYMQMSKGEIMTWTELSNIDKQIYIFLKSCYEDEWNYNALISLGQTPQQARAVLPNCLKTEIVMTANFREWLHFLELRTAPAAHPDMQVIAKMIGNKLHEISPIIFKNEYK